VFFLSSLDSRLRGNDGIAQNDSLTTHSVHCAGNTSIHPPWCEVSSGIAGRKALGLEKRCGNAVAPGSLERAGKTDGNEAGEGWLSKIVLKAQSSGEPDD
jgi:hypothetical protein